MPARLFAPVLIRGTALVALALLAAAPAARAQSLDQITIMAPAAPGGGWDATARSMQEVLQAAKIVKAVQVENVAGAGGTIGLAQFVKKRGDGKALMVSGLVMVGAILANKAPVNLGNVTPIARLTSEWQALVVPAKSDIKSFAELVAKLKAAPGSVSWGGGSAGGTDHMTAGLVAKAAGVDPAKVNYIAHSGGGQAMASILGGHVTVGVSSVSEFEAQVKAGQLRYLAVSSPARIAGVDAPTFKEAGVDLVLGNWRAVVAAPGISDADKKALLETVDKMVKSAEWKKKLADRGWIDNYLAGDAFAAFLKEDEARTGEVLRAVGLVK
jgi:putative tricarboxylic transport membrane protein